MHYVCIIFIYIVFSIFKNMFVCKISSFHFYHHLFSPLILSAGRPWSFKLLSPSDSTDLSKARFSFLDFLNVHGDTCQSPITINTFLSMLITNLIISACLSRTSAIWPCSGQLIISPDEIKILSSLSPKSQSQDQKDSRWHNNHMGHPPHPTPNF